MLRTFTIVIAVFLCWSCTTEGTFRQVSVNDLYSIDLPEYLDSTAEFNPDASLQYVNKDKAVYIMVIDQNKAEWDDNVSIDQYFNLVSRQFTQDTEQDISPASRQVNGLNSLQTEATGMENTHEIYYKLAVVESNSHFYQILAWTLLKQKDRYAGDLQRVYRLVRRSSCSVS